MILRNIMALLIGVIPFLARAFLASLLSSLSMIFDKSSHLSFLSGMTGISF